MLDLSSRGYSSRDIESLIELLKSEPNIENLQLYRNNIYGKALDTIIPALLELSKLIKLSLCYNNICDDDLGMLTPLVKKGTLKQLTLSENRGITDKSLALINSWRNTGLVVDTYHTRISLQPIKNSVEEERSCEFSM